MKWWVMVVVAAMLAQLCASDYVSVRLPEDGVMRFMALRDTLEMTLRGRQLPEDIVCSSSKPAPKEIPCVSFEYGHSVAGAMADLHVTLLWFQPAASVAASDMKIMAGQILAGIPPLDVHLEQGGVLESEDKIVVAISVSATQGLRNANSALKQGLSQVLGDDGVAFSSFPFAPHVTLLQLHGTDAQWQKRFQVDRGTVAQWAVSAINRPHSWPEAGMTFVADTAWLAPCGGSSTPCSFALGVK